MIEFKFSCPNCSQHIQCNDAYSGMQIICPTCKNQIVVPQAPGTIPAKSAVPTLPPVPQTATAAPAAVPTSFKAKGKSKTKLVVICGVAALLFIGVIAYAVLSILYPTDSQPSEVATRPAVVKKSTPENANRKQSERAASSDSSNSSARQTSSVSEPANDSRTPSASEIVRKVIEQYDSLTSYSTSGKAISIIDMSGVDPSSIPGISDDKAIAGKNAEEFKKAMSKPQRMESEFSVKLAKPDFYLVQWQGQSGLAHSKGAAWSAGEGDFLFMDMGQTKYAKMKSRELALASATGLSGGVANTMPQIFFRGSASLLNSFKNAIRGSDETIDGTDCYVLTGSAMGIKVLLWIDKSKYLIKQKQQVLGGNLEMPDMSEAKMEEGLKQLGGNPSAAQKAQMKDAIKNVKALTSKMKGTMTETYESIEINQPVTKDDFSYDVPAGTKLSSSLF